MAENTARNLIVLGSLGVLGYWWYTSMGSAKAAEKRLVPSSEGRVPSLSSGSKETAQSSGSKETAQSSGSGPKVIRTAPADGAAFTHGESVTFHFLATGIPDIVEAKFEWYDNGVPSLTWDLFNEEAFFGPSSRGAWGIEIDSDATLTGTNVWQYRAVLTDKNGKKWASPLSSVVYRNAESEPKFVENMTGEGEEGGLRSDGGMAFSKTDGGKSSWGEAYAQGRVQGLSFEDTSRYFALSPSDHGDWG